MSEHRAAGYCRVSTEEQAEHGFSLGEQERKLQEDAERRGERWTRAYIDAGVSCKRGQVLQSNSRAEAASGSGGAACEVTGGMSQGKI